jgi:hypothetical protein
MKIRFLQRDIEIAHRFNVDNFKGKGTLIGVSFVRSDMLKFKPLKLFLAYCFMPYSWLNKQFMKGKI